VTLGVTLAGALAEMHTEMFCELVLLLRATIATVLSDGFLKAAICTFEGAPVTPTRTYPGRTNLLKFPIA
jgi:hypothetical protein